MKLDNWSMVVQVIKIWKLSFTFQINCYLYQKNAELALCTWHQSNKKIIGYLKKKGNVFDSLQWIFVTDHQKVSAEMFLEYKASADSRENENYEDLVTNYMRPLDIVFSFKLSSIIYLFISF